ncbi:hypothetical protein MPL3356_460005 [Mesorhizobium plurifarium]|uniref:Uncharacterized protein n=1 Tax=Mesorhizobium plurifarium TaxID=69974 RepID=A0A090E5P2_MESPL|nr:hypothetical protein MPL3356_460005 [Mesorhizobium plurifarium]
MRLIFDAVVWSEKPTPEAALLQDLIRAVIHTVIGAEDGRRRAPRIFTSLQGAQYAGYVAVARQPGEPELQYKRF